MIWAMGLVCSRIFAYKIRKFESISYEMPHIITAASTEWQMPSKCDTLDGAHVFDKQTKQSHTNHHPITLALSLCPNGAIVKYKKTHTHRIYIGEKCCASFILLYIIQTTKIRTNPIDTRYSTRKRPDKIGKSCCLLHNIVCGDRHSQWEWIFTLFYLKCVLRYTCCTQKCQVDRGRDRKRCACERSYTDTHHMCVYTLKTSLVVWHSCISGIWIYHRFMKRIGK